MKSLSIQKISVLGLVLRAASAVTAAVLPSSKKDTSKLAANGSITASNDNAVGSCTLTAVITAPCNNTTSVGAGAVSASTARGGSLSNLTTAGDAE